MKTVNEEVTDCLRAIGERNTAHEMLGFFSAEVSIQDGRHWLTFTNLSPDEPLSREHKERINVALREIADVLHEAFPEQDG